MLAVCKPGASAMTEREAVLDLCSRFWFGDEPSESGLEKGQTRATLAQLADAWGWERQRARRLIGRLVKAGEISTENLGRCTLITCAQTSHKVRTKSAQTPHNRTERNQRVASGKRTKSAQSPHKLRTKSARNQERDKIQGTRDKGSDSLPVVESLPDATASSAPTAPDLTTKAGRERQWPIASKLPTSDGGRATYPPEFVAFRAAYPNAVKRAPSKLTYVAWRKLVISGVEPDTLRAAAERYAKDIGGPKFARRCHGPNGWLAGDEWREYAGAAHRDNPTAPQETDNRTDDERLSAMFGGLRLQVERATDEEIESIDW